MLGSCAKKNDGRKLDAKRLNGHFVFIGCNDPETVRKPWSRPDSTSIPRISAYLRSKMQCAAPVSSFAKSSTDCLPAESVIGTSIPPVVPV